MLNVKQIKKFFLTPEAEGAPTVEMPVIEEQQTVILRAELPVAVHTDYRTYYGMIVTVYSQERVKVRFFDDVLGAFGEWRELPFDAPIVELLPVENETAAEATAR